jgi:hypothetical protein
MATGIHVPRITLRQNRRREDLARLFLQANAPEQFYPGDDEPGTPRDHVERSKSQLLTGRELRQPLHDELKVSLDRPEIDVLRVGVAAWRW